MKFKTYVKDREGNVKISYEIETEDNVCLYGFLKAWENMDITHRTFEKFAHKNNIKYSIT